jgi:secondary thiamine-phosphate synthase enzyme
MPNLFLSTATKEEFIDITSQVQELINNSNVQEGLCTIQSMHTTAGITVNENADPDVKKDILKALEIFNRDDYDHAEGNSSAHIKTSFVGPSVTLLIENSKLQLGTWQGIIFCEFDGPRKRTVKVQINGSM